MRPVAEVVCAIWRAWWAAALGTGGTIESRFAATVERIIVEDRREMSPSAWDKPSEQTTVVDLRRREHLIASKATAAAQSMARRQGAGTVFGGR